MDRQVPLPSEEILVWFSLSDGRRVQWPALVEEVEVGEGNGDLKFTQKVLARATIVYEAAHGYRQERCRVLFLEGFLVRPEHASAEGGDVTSWLFDEEPKVFGGSTGAGSQDDWVEATMPRSRATMIRGRTRSSLPAGCKGGSDAEQFVSARTRRRKGSLVGEGLVRLTQAHEDLEGRVLALERSTAAARVCTHDEMIQERVNAVRVQIKIDMLEHAQRPLRLLKKVKVETDCERVLQRSAWSCSYPCDYALFRIVARNVHESFAGTDPHTLPTPAGVLFFPSLYGILHPSRRMEQASIVFETAAALFEWLGITSRDDVRAMMVREHRAEAARQMCVLGGVQWDDAVVFSPFRLFIGASCTRVPPEFENAAAKRYYVGLENVEWDDENSEFTSPVDFGEGDTGLNSRSADLCAFRIDWEWSGGTSRRAFSLHSMDCEGVRLGTVTVKAPCALIVGPQMCEAFSAKLSQRGVETLWW